MKMLKGVNRQVVEIPQPESEYFERAILFVKPEFCGVGDSGLRERAAALLKNTVRPPANMIGRRTVRLAGLMRLVLAAAVGAGLCALFTSLLR